ncbi:transposon Ty3-I gap-Pol polyprotein [Clonorchis sinensis]|uniref:Transposon Ty3-I gap-Pol polyprotein n=1 Tax=Clonorchis sinensis TaxID=79923 RepID=G7Y2V3_CLOSI|nr:transposon Ty3-I gap-Pol polyprotein [Clonorchis sinensis]
MWTDNNFKPRTNFRALNPSISRFTDRNSNSAVQKFGNCESCGRSHSRYSYTYKQAKCFICFVFSTSGSSIIGLKVLDSLRTNIVLLTSVNDNELKQLILGCSKAIGGTQIPEVKLKATGATLANAPSPTNLQELRSVLEELLRYSHFIPNFAKHASCLFDVIPANQFSWSSNCEKTLRALLGHLQISAVLKPFSIKHHSTIITDASHTGIRAILEQYVSLVICISRRLSKAERGYSQTRR